MTSFGFLLILFACIIIAYPDILAYIVATVFLLIGIQLLMVGGLIRRSEKNVWNIGGYEIHRKR